MPPPPRSTLFPYTTLFRSRSERFDFEVVTLADRVGLHRLPGLRFILEQFLGGGRALAILPFATALGLRSEEHTSELQSQSNLVCRLLLEKKNKHMYTSVLS